VSFDQIDTAQRGLSDATPHLVGVRYRRFRHVSSITGRGRTPGRD
jgi:hypothetical protein